MKIPAKVVMFVLPFFLTACIQPHLPFHKKKHDRIQMVAPPIENTTPAPAPEPVKPAPPPVTATITPTLPAVVETKPEPKPKPPASHHKKHAPKPVEQASVEPPATAETPAISAIGQLSNGDSSGLSRQTLSSIDATEKGLKGINRKLSDAEEKTASQIREFLKQARVALTTGDVDGAATLAAKAKVLLGELTQ